MTALSGEFPADQLSRLIPSQAYAEKVITQLKAEKLIRIHCRDKLRGYRLTKKSKEMLLQDNPARFAFYLTGNTETNQIRSEPARRIRLHQKSEAYITLYHAGIPIYPDAKPALFSSGSSISVVNMQNFPLFYSSREIKQLGPDTTKIRNSRSIGILLTEKRAYVLYNTGCALLKWEYRTEIRVNAFLQYYLRGNPYHCPPEVRGIMLGRNMDTALRLLTSTGGYKKSLFMLDTSYGHFHYIPNTLEGEALLKLLCDTKMQQKLNRLLGSDLLSSNEQLTIEHDAMTSNGDVVLFAYDFDMIRINKFNTALKLFGYHGVLIAFDFQMPVLKEYLGTGLQYSSIDFQKFRRGFLHEPP
ncbi:MAG: hypothetical protein Q4D16_15705 [Eubacteriales bacterium]|nr:hypothetical protein [Eubacteriales bacterium]